MCDHGNAVLCVCVCDRAAESFCVKHAIDVSTWFTLFDVIFIRCRFLFVTLSWPKPHWKWDWITLHFLYRTACINENARHQLDMCNIIASRSMQKKTKQRNSGDAYISWFDFESEATYTHRRLCSARHFCGAAEDGRRAQRERSRARRMKRNQFDKEKQSGRWKSIEPLSKDSSAPKNSRLQFLAHSVRLL